MSVSLERMREVDKTHEEASSAPLSLLRRQSKYLSRFLSPKTRQKFIRKHFAHMRDLNQRYAPA